jgi:hypothetical protein
LIVFSSLNVLRWFSRANLLASCGVLIFEACPWIWLLSFFLSFRFGPCIEVKCDIPGLMVAMPLILFTGIRDYDEL